MKNQKKVEKTLRFSSLLFPEETKKEEKEDTKEKVRKYALAQKLSRIAELKIDVYDLVCKKGLSYSQVLEKIGSSALWKCVEVDKLLEEEKIKNGET